MKDNGEIKPNQGESKNRKRRFLGLATSGQLDNLRDPSIHLDEVQAENYEENGEIKPNQGESKSRKRRFLGLATSGQLDNLRDLAIHLDEVQAQNNEAQRNQIKSGTNMKFINYSIMALGRNKTGDLQEVV